MQPCCSKITVSIRYTDLVSVLPTRVKVLAWPLHPSKKVCTSTAEKKENERPSTLPVPVPIQLSYAEDALRTMSLPEGTTF